MPNKWIKSRGANGYLNLETNQFRTTIPSSSEENKQNQIKRNKAALTQLIKLDLIDLKLIKEIIVVKQLKRK